MSRREAYCQKLFGETPAEALTRLHRYESQVRRAWHTALREIPIQQKFGPRPLLPSPSGAIETNPNARTPDPRYTHHMAPPSYDLEKDGSLHV